MPEPDTKNHTVKFGLHGVWNWGSGHVAFALDRLFVLVYRISSK